jgi:hypothetical protein
MRTKLTGTNPDKPTINIEFFETGRQLVYLDGTKPFFRTGLTVEEAKTVLAEAGYTITEEEIE